MYFCIYGGLEYLCIFVLVGRRTVGTTRARAYKEKLRQEPRYRKVHGAGERGGEEKYKNEFVSAVGKIMTNVVAEL